MGCALSLTEHPPHPASAAQAGAARQSDLPHLPRGAAQTSDHGRVLQLAFGYQPELNHRTGLGK